MLVFMITFSRLHIKIIVRFRIFFPQMFCHINKNFYATLSVSKVSNERYKLQTSIFQLPFTDIDYHVFSDAAKLVWQGRSPFDRESYRYTPIIAWMLVPNVFFPDFGLVFIKTN